MIGAMKAMNSTIGRLEGARVRLRLVDPSDAPFIHGLRVDPALNTHLSPVDGSVAGQRAWIERYKAREAAGTEYYYLIERADGVPCGTVRLYNIGEQRFTWGSWILNEDKPPKAAIESALLSFGVGFETLGLDIADVDVRIANERAIAFYRRLGMTEVRRDEKELFFTFSAAQFADAMTAFATLETTGTEEKR